MSKISQRTKGLQTKQASFLIGQLNSKSQESLLSRRKIGLNPIEQNHLYQRGELWCSDQAAGTRSAAGTGQLSPTPGPEETRPSSVGWPAPVTLTVTHHKLPDRCFCVNRGLRKLRSGGLNCSGQQYSQTVVSFILRIFSLH